MITITACYMKVIKESDLDITYDMWVEDAPHIRASGCESLEQAKDVLNYLIKEELHTMWRVTGEYEIVEYKGGLECTLITIDL